MKVKPPIYRTENKDSKHVSITLLLFFISLLSQAQYVVVTSGNVLSGSGGTASYSVGQTIQENTTGSNGSSIQGIQFYFESSTLTIIDLATNLEISTYPNPTTSIVNIYVDDFKPNTLTYKLFTSSGKLINSGRVTDKTTNINMDHLDMATYLLKVDNTTNQSTKTFKIIKK